MRIAVVGLGVIGKRLAAAIGAQPDLKLAGIALRSASPAAWAQPDLPLYASEPEAMTSLREAGITPLGTLEDLLASADLVVDCGPSRTGATRAPRYAAAGVDAVFCGGERDPSLGPLVHSALNFPVVTRIPAVRLASCNTTALGRVVAAVRPDSIAELHATVLRCATDTDKAGKGVTNGIVLDGAPSHHAADLRTLAPGLCARSVAATVPMTCGHAILLRLRLCVDAALAVRRLRAATRITVAGAEAGPLDSAARKHAAARAGLRWAQRFEVAVQLCQADGSELVCWLLLDNESVTIPEALDVLRARGGIADGGTARALTDENLPWMPDLAPIT